MAKDWSKLTSTERDQFDDLKIRDIFSFFFLFNGDEDTFNIIGDATTKYVWDILQKTYEERKTETSHGVRGRNSRNLRIQKEM